MGLILLVTIVQLAVKRVPQGHREWQPSSGTRAGDVLERKARVGRVEQSVVPGVEPIEHRVSRSVHRRLELLRCGDSVDCDRCSEAPDGVATGSRTE